MYQSKTAIPAHFEVLRLSTVKRNTGKNILIPDREFRILSAKSNLMFGDYDMPDQYNEISTHLRTCST
jgi:hypothetical protein